MNRIIDAVVQDLKSFLKEIESVEGIVVYGSYGRGEVDFYSDIDIIIYVSENSNPDIISNKIVDFIDRKYGIMFSFFKHGKLTIYTKNLYENYFLKLEIKTKRISDASLDDIVVIRESRIDRLENAVLFDRSGRVLSNLQKLWNNLPDKNMRDLIREYILSFLYYYEGFMVQYSRGDMFRAYMNYTIAFYKLASLLALMEGETRNLYQPWFLTRIIKNKNFVRAFYEASSTMDPLDLFYKKEKMLTLFLNVVEKLRSKYGTNINKDYIYEFIKLVKAKFSVFYNFRRLANLLSHIQEELN